MGRRPRIREANRFAILDTGQIKRKKKSDLEISAPLSAFPLLPETKIVDPKFIIISTTDPLKPLSSYSCFAIHRAIQQISSQVHSITFLRDGKLLLLVKSSEIAYKFLRVKTLGDICDVSVTFHQSLNHVKGTAYAPFLINDPEEEIIKELVFITYPVKLILPGVQF